MATTVPDETCRFCQHYDTKMQGVKVCECDGHCGYAHYKCFFSYVRETGRRKCDYCHKEWFVDKLRWKHDVAYRKRMTVCNRVREAGSILLTIITILAMIVVWGMLTKVAVYWIYGSPNYVLFDIPLLTSNGWTRITLADITSGGFFTLATILLAILIVHMKPRCYRHCCIKKKTYKKVNPDILNGEEGSSSNSGGLELNELKTLRSMSDGKALEHSRSLSRQLSIQSAVELAVDSSDDDDDEKIPHMDSNNNGNSALV